MKAKVLVAMSGGIDSSSAPYILLERGYEVIGVSMHLWDNASKCCSEKDIENAKKVARKLGIPHYVYDFRTEFKKEVIDYFLDEYLNGKTPNPCIVCNKKIKFKLLLKKTKELGVKYVATGHYARLKKNDRFLLKRGEDKSKDQSYFLFMLSQNELKKVIFPMGNYHKKDVKTLVKELGFDFLRQDESQEVCFVKDRYEDFIKSFSSQKIKPGAIVDKNGNYLGEHRGIPFYTIGQRRGLGIAYKEPLYVIGLNKKKNLVIVGRDEDTYSKSLTARNLNWISINRLTESMEVKAKIRYRHEPADAVIRPLGDDEVLVEFKEVQRAITPGQAVVFYDKNTVVGGGWIEYAGIVY